MLKPMYLLVDGINIPDELIDLVMCQENKIFIEDPVIQDWVESHLTTLGFAFPGVRKTLKPCSNHVHISDQGLTPHNHLPHAYTSVLYIMDAEGELVLGDPDDCVRLKPKAGRFVFFPADLMHSVEASAHAELRIALVTNYEYPSV